MPQIPAAGPKPGPGARRQEPNYVSPPACLAQGLLESEGRSENQTQAPGCATAFLTASN